MLKNPDESNIILKDSTAEVLYETSYRSSRRPGLFDRLVDPQGLARGRTAQNRLTKLDVAAFYCSPLGRAKDTSKATLNALGRTAEIFDWLREFDGYVVDPESGEHTYSWDRTPAFLSENDDYYDKDKWISTPFYSSGDVPEKYKAVCDGIDELLARHGYIHDGKIYRVERENSDTVVLFCHFGVECVLLSHILKISPVVLWHNFVALPTSVTTLITEEREQGKAVFRCNAFGDISHLYAGDEPASFQARFCETYSNFDERH